MFTKHSLEAAQGLRQEKLHQLLDYVQNCCDAGRAVDVHEATFTTTLNLMSATLFSFQATEFESRATQDFKEIIQGTADIIGVANLADYFPILKPFDPQGVLRKAEYYFRQLLGKIDGYLVERLESRRNLPDAPKKNDLLETLVDINTNTSTIEWIMTELLLNPDKLGKLKQELKSVVGEKRLVEESDVAGLPYLQAVIKEVFRYHPPGPLLAPRVAVSDCQVDAYLIPKGTQILTNVWAIGRDPSIWANPESFEPERFLGKRTDFKGQDFELIPFGAGRRICPGIPLADRILHMTTAALVHNYDWKLEVGIDEGDHRAELFGCGDDMERIFAKRTWQIKPGYLRLQRWVQDFNPYKVSSSVAQNPNIITALASAVGTVIKLYDRTTSRSMGRFAWYERLPEFCNYCNIIGHATGNCSTSYNSKQAGKSISLHPEPKVASKPDQPAGGTKQWVERTFGAVKATDNDDTSTPNVSCTKSFGALSEAGLVDATTIIADPISATKPGQDSAAAVGAPEGVVGIQGLEVHLPPIEEPLGTGGSPSNSMDG
ncbi:hypothetical protein ACS0TY_012089 [Phlomoides rotata]